METSTNQLTVEACLAELREMFRGKWISLDLTESHTIGPRGKHSLEHSRVTLQVDSTSGDLIYNTDAHSLGEAMAQVRAWKEQ